MKRLTATICLVVTLGLIAGAFQADAAAKKKAKKGKAKSPAVKEDSLPASAVGFGGGIQGKVVAKRPNEVVLQIVKITKVWKANKAVDPKSLVGKRIAVVCRVDPGKRESAEAKFLNGLTLGRSITVEVKHMEGNSLTLIRIPK
jgi:hypothetical protein